MATVRESWVAVAVLEGRVGEGVRVWVAVALGFGVAVELGVGVGVLAGLGG